MWSDPIDKIRQSKVNLLRRGLAGCLVLGFAFASHTGVHAAESELPISCLFRTDPATAAPVEAIDNCVEFGTAVGELGLEWRQKLPDNVRWITHKDAVTLCSQAHSAWGQKVANPMDQACVFLSPKACTIVTASYVSHAMLGNAVRNCAP